MALFLQSENKIQSVRIPRKRIVSLVPSITELLWSLGLEEEVIGITKFCVHPQEWFQTKSRVGGTKHFHQDRILAMNPDLVLANKEENSEDQIRELSKHTDVWLTEISDLPEALDMVVGVGKLSGRENEAVRIRNTIARLFNDLAPLNPGLRTAYLIWQKPFMTVGGDTFISDMMRRCGLLNVYEKEKRYPETNADELLKRDVELILLSSEPYPFREQHLSEWQTRFPHCRIELVDGEMFSWYGSRMLHAPEYFARLQQKLRSFGNRS